MASNWGVDYDWPIFRINALVFIDFCGIYQSKCGLGLDVVGVQCGKLCNVCDIQINYCTNICTSI